MKTSDEIGTRAWIAIHDQPVAMGERLASFVKLAIAAVMVVFLITYRITSPHLPPGPLAEILFTTLAWSTFAVVASTVISRGYYKPWISYVSVSLDLGLIVCIIMLSNKLNVLRFVGNMEASLFFVMIALASLRRSAHLVVLTGFASGVIYLLLSAYLFSKYIPSGGMHPTFDDSPVQGITFLDQATKAILMAVTGWLIGHMSKKIGDTQRQYETLFENVPDGVLIVSAAGLVQTANGEFSRLLRADKSAIEGKPLSTFFDGTLGDDYGDQRNISLLRPNGDVIPVSTTRMEVALGGTPHSVISIRNMEEQVALTRQIEQIQSMDTLGKLAGGMAHDLNNLLGGILGSASMINRVCDKLDDDVGKKLSTYMTLVRDSAVNASDVIKNLLTFSRQSKLEFERSDLLEILDSAVSIFASTVTQDVKVSLKTKFSSAPAELDRASVTQALMNLLINARDAMGGQGEIELLLEDLVPDRSMIIKHPGVNPYMDYWCVKVIDSGAGMDAQTSQRILEPFFSTKTEARKGSGLGFSVTYSIIKRHAGFLDVQSTQGVGTAVSFCLPQARSSSFSIPPDGETR